MNYSAIHFLKGKSMDWDYGAVNKVYRCGPRGRCAPRHSGRWSMDLHSDLISIVHSGMSSQDWAAMLGGDQHDARGSAWGTSPVLSLALALVALSLQHLHLRVLRRMGVLTEVHEVVDEVRHGLAMRKQTQEKSVRSQDPCGSPLASVLLPPVAAILSQQPIGRG
jgi:hypothetical protein